MQIEPEQWSTLSRLLDEALDIPINGLERWLDSLPPGDAMHRAKLRELLLQHAAAETGDFLLTLPKVTKQASPDPDAATQIVPGTVIGPYVVEEEIGRGGMGAVWRARRSDGVIKRPVALKLPHVGPYGQQLIERFARERDILGELLHPNIARLDDAGLTASGQPYLALEYVPGAQLMDYCDDLRLDVRGRLELSLQVLRAVQHAHSHLVIHRDLKPSNVIVTPEGQAMLLDFGIAKLMPHDPLDDADDRKTQMGAMALTPEFASPEQISGKPVSTASDIYSLGVLLFELLTGDRPYRLKRSTRGALEEAILGSEPQRPSHAVHNTAIAAARGTTVKNLCRTLRGDLDTIILKALKKSPAERYSTVDALSRDIEHYLRGEPVTARADGTCYRLAKFVGRHKLPVAAVTGAALALVAIAAVALFEAHMANNERDRALALSARNEAVTEFVNMLVTEAGGANKPVTISDMLARSESLVAAEYHGNPDHRAAILGVLGTYYHTIGEDKRGEPLLRDALVAIRGSADPDLRRELTCKHAITLAALEKVKEATDALNSVINDPGSSAQQSAECLEYLAFIAQDGADAANALKYGNLALERLNQVQHPSPTLEGLFLGSVGFAEQLNGRNDAAERYYQRALAQFAAGGRDRSPDAISVRNNWAIVSLGAGEPLKALQLYDATLAIVAEKDPGARPPVYLLGNRARALEAVGRYAAAREAYSQCMSDAGAGAQATFCVIGLASVAQAVGDLATATNLIEKAAASISASVPAGFPSRLSLHLMRAKVAVSKQQFSAAHAELDAALSNAKMDALVLTGLAIRSELNLDENNVPAALDDARRALSLAQKAQGGVPYSSRVGQAWLLVGRALAKQGEGVQAKQAVQEAIEHLSKTVDPDHPLLRDARAMAL
jgi:eukaryotic-like serine/threonine-protein kinase